MGTELAGFRKHLRSRKDLASDAPGTVELLQRGCTDSLEEMDDALMIEASATPLTTRHFLIVEPDPLFRLLLCVAFAGQFSDFSAVATFAEAQTLLREQYFAAVVTEYHLPGGTGFTLYRDVRRSMPNVPFVLMCGGSPVTILDPRFRYFGKPFSVTELAETLGEMMEDAAYV